MSTKTCGKCKIEKIFSEFYANKNSVDGLQGYCKPCNKEANKKYYASTTERQKEWRRNTNLKRSYGISLDQKIEMAEDQDYRCSICHQQFLDERKLCVDHNHITGEVRELLCSRCNQVTGFFEKSPEIVEKILMYLKRYSEN